MFTGSLMIIGGFFLYWLLKPPVPNKPVFHEEVVYPRDPSLKGEGLAGCLNSQPLIR